MRRYEVYWLDPRTNTGDAGVPFEELGEAHSFYLDMIDESPHLTWVLSTGGAEITHYDPE